MSCPICEKRKAKRFCPARAESICSQCCGTEREVTIDCPSDCPHLVASRQYDLERKDIDWSKGPFAQTKFRRSVVAELGGLIDALARSICQCANEHRPLTDLDAQAAIESLAETYRTLSSGLYYERPPDYAYQRELYLKLKEGIEEYKKAHPALADEMQRIQERKLPDGWDADIPTFPADAKGVAGRDASGKVLNAPISNRKSSPPAHPISSSLLRCSRRSFQLRRRACRLSQQPAR